MTLLQGDKLKAIGPKDEADKAIAEALDRGTNEELLGPDLESSFELVDLVNSQPTCVPNVIVLAVAMHRLNSLLSSTCAIHDSLNFPHITCPQYTTLQSPLRQPQCVPCAHPTFYIYLLASFRLPRTVSPCISTSIGWVSIFLYLYLL
jgi:hypothetical protein